jgi:predicted nuclease of predicted toxin-antitoxin system
VEHVHSCNLGSADNAVWDYAKAHGFTIVSKDSDFSERSFLYGSPPKVIWIRFGNCSTTEIEELLRAAKELIQKFVEDDLETCLVLGRMQPNSPSE